MGNCNSNPTEGCDNNKIVEELTDFYKGIDDLLVITNTKFKEAIDKYNGCCDSSNSKLTDIKEILQDIVEDEKDCCEAMLANLQKIIDELDRVVDPDYTPATTETPEVPDYYPIVIKYGDTQEEMCDGVVATVFSTEPNLRLGLRVFDSPTLENGWHLGKFIIQSPFTGDSMFMLTLIDWPELKGVINSQLITTNHLPICQEPDVVVTSTPQVENDIISDMFALNTDIDFICTPDNATVLFYAASDGQWEGKVMYTDPELQHPVTGYRFIRFIFGSKKFDKHVINAETGRVGAKKDVCEI
jgi:hypothetical protein